MPPVLPADIQLQVADMQAWQAADNAVESVVLSRLYTVYSNLYAVRVS